VKLAVVLFNLGGPDSPEAVEPFLRNLFSDPAVISLPGLLRLPLARFIARRRAPVARAIYARIGGRSPILAETEAQARALEAELGSEAKVFIAMRCWKPFSDETARDVAAWEPDRIVLLPLYPQFSTTTTASSLRDWQRAAATTGIKVPTRHVCCYPQLAGLIEAMANLSRQTMAKAKSEISYRWLFSAHGLPKRVIARGDPYQWQMEQTAAALAARLDAEDWTICYQSRVGPLEWIGPSTDAEIRKAGADGKGVVVVPIAFVSEHSETLVELDIEYAKLAQEAGVRDYLRVPTVGVRQEFISGLASLVLESGASKQLCPGSHTGCGHSWI
jgi:protoporphyrin/coproporphyrin ferrochelatase